MKILIAEDEKPIANSLKKNLDLEGFESVIVYDGQAAMHELLNSNYDLLLADWRMPKKNGYELCVELRNAGNSIPIVLLTALSDVSNKVDALNAGADDYITKPFSIEEVIARIDAVLRRSHATESKINCKIFTLNLVTHSIELEDRIVKLSEKEFELLNYLVVNKGTVLNKDKIIEKVWGLSFSPPTNFVEVTIKNLRKKIEELTNLKCIKTIYGEGYVFMGEG